MSGSLLGVVNDVGSGTTDTVGPETEMSLFEPGEGAVEAAGASGPGATPGADALGVGVVVADAVGVGVYVDVGDEVVVDEADAICGSARASGCASWPSWGVEVDASAPCARIALSATKQHSLGIMLQSQSWVLDVSPREVARAAQNRWNGMDVTSPSETDNVTSSVKGSPRKNLALCAWPRLIILAYIQT